MESKIVFRKIEGLPGRGRHDSRFGWLPVTTGYQNFGLRVVTGYHLLPEFGSQDGYQLPLVTRILVSGTS